MTPANSSDVLLNDGDDGLVIELGVVEPIEQMHGSGPRSGQADSRFTRELGIPASHEGCHFLMPCLNEADIILHFRKRAHDAVYPIARITEYSLHASVRQSFKSSTLILQAC